MIVTVPHSILVNLAYDNIMGPMGSAADNVFAVLGNNNMVNVLQQVCGCGVGKWGEGRRNGWWQRILPCLHSA